VKLKTWHLLILVGTSALVLFAILQIVRPGPPARVLDAVQNKVPGIKIESAQPETFNNRPAWEVTGTDKNGTRWMIDVRGDGKIIMYEPLY
jgi:hypothetical protein